MMADNSDRIANVLYNKLDSNKIKERKDAFEELKVLLTESNFTAVLDRNSVQKSRNGIGWNQIFAAAHNGALKEAELCLKDDTSRAKKIFNVKLLISVISSLAAKANSDVERLSANVVISNVLDAFETPFYREIFAEGYSKLLHDCILSRQKYWAEISPAHWIDLLNFFKVLLEEATTENTKCTLISCLNHICLHGANCAKFFPHIHKLLKQLPDILDKIDMDSTPRLQLNVVEFCLTICQQAKEEYRLSVCKFGELKFSQFLTLYQSRDNANKKELIAKLLTEIVEVHHPCGLPAESPGALAFSWEIWKSQLRDLYECLENQISSITNSRNVLSPFEVHLAVICAKQVFSETCLNFNSQESPEVFDTECVVKKRKLNSGVENLIGVLESKNVADIGPLLIFIEALMGRHPEMFNGEDFFKLLNFASEKLPVCNVPNVTTQLCRIVIQLVSLEEKLKVTENSKEIQKLWSTIWNSSMNFLSLSKQIGLRQPSEETHPLVRALIKRGCQSFMADSLLNLYSNGVLPFSDECLKTFVSLCQNYAITENLDLRIKLLKWCVVDRDLEECSLSSLCGEAIFALSLKSKLPSEHQVLEDTKWKESELYFLSTSLEKIPKNPKTKKSEPRNVIEHVQFISRMINLLKEKQENFIGVTDLLVVIPYSTVLAVISSLFQKHKISFSNDINNLLDESLNMLWPSLASQFNESREEVMSELLKAANVLFTVLVKSPHFAGKKDLKILSDRLSKTFFHDYNPMVASQRSQMGFDVFEDACEVDSSTVPLIQLNALKLIVHLGTINSICNNKYEIEENLFQRMNSKIDFSSSKGFKIVLTILEMIYAREKVQSDILSFVMYFLSNLYKLHYKNHEDFLTTLNLTKSTIHHIYLSEEVSHHNDLCELMSACSKIIVTKNKYDGPNIVKGFLDVLIPMVKIDRGYKWKIDYGGNGEDLPIALHILEFFKSPFNQVRFKAAEYIPVIFQDEKPSQDLLEIQKIAFAKLMESVSELFTVKGDLDEDDIQEECLKRSCCALNIISAIISNSCTWRRKAVFKLVALISSKKIKRSLIKRVLNQIQVDMKLKNVIKFLEQNLEYVIFKWYNLFKNFTEFPFSMLDCLDKKEFYMKYKNYVVPSVVFRKDETVLSEIAEVCGIEIASLIKVCFGDIFTNILACLTDVNHVNTVQAYLTKLIGASAFQELCSQNFEKSIVGLYGKLNDYDNFVALCGGEHSIAFPEKIPSDIDRQGITVGLKYLQEASPSKEVDLLVMVGTDHPVVLYNIMHTLFTSITEATCHEIRALYFSQYITFCDDLLKNFVKLKRMGAFILRQLIHALLIFCGSELATPVLHFMHGAIKVSMPHSATIVNDLLPHIIPNMVSFVKNDVFSSGAAMRVLQLLLIEHRSFFEGVDNLDPLPQSEKFSCFKKFESRRVSQSLKETIENFLKAGSQNLDPSFRIEGLEHLSRQLIGCKKELENLYGDLKMSRGFSEDCRQSPIHRLIISLVKLTTCKNQEVSKLAAKCLGEIGPCDLSTLVLMPESNSRPHSFLLKIVQLLIPLLVHNDPELISSTSSVFLELFGTQEGFEIKDSLTIHEKCYIFPFFPKTKKTKKSQNLTPSSDIITGLNNWCPIHRFISHEEWIVNLVISILSSFDQKTYLYSLIKIIKSQVYIAEEILPYLVYKLLKQNDEELSSKIEKMINLFFKNHFDLEDSLFRHSENVYLNRASVQCMLKVINFYRQEETVSEIKLKRVLEIDYLYAARAAQFCNAYFTSVLYAELWIEKTLSSCEKSEKSFNVSPLEKICCLKPEEATNLQNLLWEAYKEIGEYDAVYGCGDIRLVETSGRIKFYSQMGLWSKVIEECEMNQNVNNQDLINALRFSGSLNTAMSVSYSSQPDFDCAWRLADWSLVPKEESYSGSIYGALKAIKNNDVTTSLQFVDHARDLVISNLEHASLEAANSIYQPLSQLRILGELENCEENSSWRNESGRWIDFEPIYFQRGLLAKNESLPEVWLNMAEKATKNESYLIAQRCLNQVLRIKPDKNIADKINMKIAQLSWMTGDMSRAKYLMKNLMDENNKTEPSILIESLLTYGSWMADSKSEPIQMIMDKYFKTAKEKLDAKNNTPKELHSAAETLGKYSYAEYLRLKQYVNSTEFNELLQNTDLSKKKLDEFKGGNKVLKDHDYLKAEKSYAVQINLADKESQSIKEKMSFYLQFSIIHYLKCLIYGEGDSNDLKMFRFVSLWLNSSSQIKNIGEVRKLIKKVTSHKFIIVLPQLAARISDDDLPFSQILNDIIMTCCKEHPYHALPTILALVNSHKDELYLENAAKKRPVESLKPRVRGAIKLYKLLMNEDKIKDIILKMDNLFLSYISLANCKISPNMKPGDYKIPISETIRKMKDLKNLPCITTNIPVNPSGDYSDIVYIKGFEEVYSLIGGINQPKKVKCLCSDGISREQLVKGKDDLRQDAVMQQVFKVMNILLRSEEQTACRKLLIRTYKIVPLSQRSGLIEWVNNTMPLGEYLAGHSSVQGAHKKYRPKDLSPIECRIKMNEVKDRNAETKLQVYLALCNRMKPVFRHFFTEKFPTPSLWFESRLAYTRSIATNSMIGYILGIGDRHAMNILLDLKTAEVIHIDFGIAFEQAQILPTPETVPFRLTRDIVDGMGVTGVEGVFRRCCEETVRVLRKCQEPILTTLEVLLYDPLYTWTINPQKAQNLQSDDKINSTVNSEEKSSEELNSLAMWALQRLKQKFEGREEGSTTGVEGQVNYLINKATDPANLSALYHGWQACL